nr:hypothetical protein [Rhodopseudomonas faecalis]
MQTLIAIVNGVMRVTLSIWAARIRRRSRSVSSSGDAGEGRGFSRAVNAAASRRTPANPSHGAVLSELDIAGCAFIARTSIRVANGHSDQRLGRDTARTALRQLDRVRVLALFCSPQPLK